MKELKVGEAIAYYQLIHGCPGPMETKRYTGTVAAVEGRFVSIKVRIGDGDQDWIFLVVDQSHLIRLVKRKRKEIGELA